MTTKCPTAFFALALAFLLPVTALAANGPSISTQPQSTNVLAGSNAVFTVVASGQLPLSYQWSFNTVNLTNSSHIKGATTATLTVSNITAADDGNYQVLVSNSHGSIASSNASLTVLFPPAITTQPVSQSILVSNSVVFGTSVTGTLPLSFQWYFNGAALTDGPNILGSTTPNLSLSNLQISEGGSYQLVVTNNYGSATSMMASLTILIPAVITLQPTNQSILLSNNVTFAASATGTLPLGYQWYFNGAPLTDGNGIIGSTAANLNLSNAQTSEAGAYQLVVTNLYGSATSAMSSLTVLVPSTITVQPTNFVSSIGSAAIFSVTASGTGSLTYQWQENGTNLTDGGQITGSGTSALTISNIVMNNVGSYSVTVTNSYGTASSAQASLLVVPIVMWGGTAGSGGGNFTPALTNTIAIAWGEFDFGVALNNYSTVSAWGNSEYNQLDVPAGLSNVVSISAGSEVALALENNGTVVGWGNNGNAQTPPAGLTNVVQVSAGNGFCLALKNDGTVAVWGSPTYNYGQTTLPAGLTNVVAVAAGLYHALALKNDGTIVGWGYNAYGEATSPAGATNIVAIGAGSVHSVALKSDGTVMAWGYDGSGQTNVPNGLSNVVAIAVGAWHNLALKRDGTVVTWGSDNWGESDTPAGLSNVVAVGANDDASVALVQNPTAPAPPAIWWQGPTNNITLTSATTILNPYVIGSLPMNFQWYFNGAPLTGQSNQWLLLNALQINQAGNYSLIVSNNYGSVTNTVSIIPATPSIITQPVTQNVFPSANASFTVGAAPGPLNYQWYFNGTPLTDGGNVSGSATATLSVQNVQSANYGNYQVIVTNQWGSITSSVAGLTQALIHYVNASNTTPVAPYTNWASAATNIQTAIGVAIAGDEVLVTNGVYNYGDYTPPGSGYAPNRVALLQPISVISVNGPAVTQILGADGSGYQYSGYGRRCAYVTNGALLAGFSLSAGRVDFQSTSDPLGGGVECASASAVVSNCVITGNFARVYGGGAYGGTLVNCVIANNTGVSPFISEVGDGGGAYAANLLNCVVTNNVSHRGGGVESCALTNCLVVNNAVSDYGGGAYDSQLVNCTVVGNTVNTNGDGGGMFGGIAENSIIVSNTATPGGGLDNYSGSTFAYCCTVPNPGGTGNIATDPLFINFAGGNDRLQSGSPCIDTGNNSFITMSTDLDGNPRIVNGVVDMGASEYQHAPWFLVSPTNQTIVAGSNLVLTATILGDPAVYQWYYNGAPLSDGGRIIGSGSNTLTIAMTVTNDSGSYWMTASNSYGMVTSAVAAVTVQLAVNIIGQPANQIVLLGSNATFTANAIGFVPPNYLWYSNGIAMTNGGRISGATSNTLTISTTQTNDTAAYQVVVTNIYGSVTSSIATLTVISKVQIIGQPGSQDALLGTNISFMVAAGGTGPFTYQWYFNGAPLSDGGRISGSATTSLNIANVQSADAGGYRVVVSNLLSSATSLTASLTPQTVIGPSVRYVMLTSTNPQSPYLNWSTAATNIQDAVDAAVIGDSVVVSNGTYNVGGRLVYGTNAPNRVVINKAISVQSLNGPAATTIIGFNTFAGAYFPGRCAYLTNGAFLTGFTLTKGGAGTASSGDLVHDKSGGGVWCEGSGAVISNCVIFGNSASSGYGGGAFGGTLFNCLLTTNSGGGGGGAASNILFNCTLIKNSSGSQILPFGGGAYDSMLSNCVLAANAGGSGGGAYGGVLFNCILTNNIGSNGAGGESNVLYNCILAYNLARGEGGGAFNSTLYNCTVVTNFADGTVGGSGIWGGAATNCIIYYNFQSGSDVVNSKNIAYCCVSSLSTFPGCITNVPLFVSLTNGNFHLQSNSPCINSGENAAVTVSTDLVGNPRIVGGTVDMGAYEYQSPASIISYAWLEQYGLPTDGSVDFSNLDGTSFNVYQDYLAGLNPTNSASVLQANLGVFSSGITILWPSVSTRNYYVQRSTNLVAQPFITIQSFIAGHTGTASYTDTTATNGGPYYYRVGVLLP